MTPSVRRPPVWRLYLYMLAPSLVVVGLVCTLAVGSVHVLGAVRAYASGESLWSKGRSAAVEHLRDYANSRDERDFVRFEQALAVPLGDRRAREGIAMPHPDLSVIRQGFLDGGNHPDDIDGMITLLRRFGDQALFQGALASWAEGDALIAQLRDTAEVLRERVQSGGAEQDVHAALRDVQRLNDQLIAAETRFGANLGVASRFTERLLTMSISVSAVTLSLLSFLVMRRGWRREELYQQELARANRRWELAAVGAEVGLFELETDGSEVVLDAHAASLYGLPREPITVTGRDLLQRIEPQEHEQLREAVLQAVENGALFRVTFRLMGDNGRYRVLESIGSVIDATRPGPSKRVIGVVRDATEDVANAQLAIERDAAEKVAESQRHFLSRLSHELRTPLNAILGFAQLLSIDRQHPLPPTQQKQVNWILEAGQQLLNLIEDVLDLSKVEAGEISVSLQPTSLSEVLRASLVLVEPARQRHEVTIIDRLPDPTPFVVADPQRLQQVFVNLLTNACKYNHPGGHITVDAREDNGRILVEIADNGIGLSAEDAAELFQPFRRVTAVSAKVEGTGLGLYIVKQLVERMEGEVTVSSEPGVGSRFTVSLPRALAPVAQPMEAVH